ncbi:MAG TPA: hypothetical protein VJ891_12595 [Casimicrobiaceae bacterium]|nr:hypothetical protein [Casimicrobiaceae bacterium]
MVRRTVRVRRLAKTLIKRFLAALRTAFLTPTPKQKELYGRFWHTLAAAAVIADTSMIFTPNSPFGPQYSLPLFVAAVVLFIGGALLSKGE